MQVILAEWICAQSLRGMMHGCVSRISNVHVAPWDLKCGIVRKWPEIRGRAIGEAFQEGVQEKARRRRRLTERWSCRSAEVLLEFVIEAVSRYDTSSYM